MKQKKLFALLSCFIISLSLFSINTAFIPQTSPEMYDLKNSADLYEPNDIPGEAWSLGAGYYPNLNCSDDDWFLINPGLGDTSVIAEITFNHSKGNLDLFLYDPWPTLVDNSSRSNSTFYSEKVGVYLNTPRQIYLWVRFVDMPNTNYSLNITYIPGNIFESIEIVTPNIGSNWQNGTWHWINWTSIGPTTNVNITLLNAGLTPLFPIINEATNIPSQFYWLIPNLPTGTYHILVIDSYKPGLYDISDGFIINNTGGGSPVDSINITSPQLGENWSTELYGTMITWSTNGTVPFVEIILLNASQNPVWPIANTPNTGSFDWFIPYNISSGSYYILIRDPGRPFINDTSANFTITNVGPTIQVQTPASGINWINGSTNEIQWSNSGNLPDNMTIQLLNASHSYLSTINVSTENDGSYMWAINQSSGDYHIRVKYNTSLYGDSDLFTIGSTGGPYIYVDSPLMGEKWFNGTSYWINWSSSGDVQFVNIKLLNMSLFTVYTIENFYTNGGSYLWTIPSIFQPGDYYIEIENASTAFPNGRSDQISILNSGSNNTGDFIEVTSPGDDDVWVQNSTYEITWVYNESFTMVSIELWNESGYIMDIAINTTNTGSLIWTIPEKVNAGDYHIRIYDSLNPSIIGKSKDFRIGKKLVPGFPLLIISGVSIVAIVSIIRKQSKKRKMNL